MLKQSHSHQESFFSQEKKLSPKSWGNTLGGLVSVIFKIQIQVRIISLAKEV